MKFLQEVAVEIAKDLASHKMKVHRQKTGLVNKLTDFTFSIDFVKNKVFEMAKAQVMKMWPAVDKGYEVVMQDTNNAGLSWGIGQVQKGLENGIKRRRITALDRVKILSHLNPTRSYEPLRKADIVIEDINIKRVQC